MRIKPVDMQFFIQMSISRFKEDCRLADLPIGWLHKKQTTFRAHARRTVVAA